MLVIRNVGVVCAVRLHCLQKATLTFRILQHLLRPRVDIIFLSFVELRVISASLSAALNHSLNHFGILEHVGNH